MGDYSNAWVRSGSYGRWGDDLNLGLLLRGILAENHVLEVYEAYLRTNFFQEPLTPEDNRDGDGLRAYASWIWGYKRGGFLNTRFEYRTIDTKGSNWDNQAFALSLNALIPLKDKVALQLYGEAARWEYDNIHTSTFIPGLGPPRARRDKFYQGSAALTWEFYKHTTLVLQFIAIRDDSNLVQFDYDRQIYIAGLEYAF